MIQQEKTREPFLLFVSIGTPHFPHNTAPDEFMQLYSKNELELSENVPGNMREWARKELQGYYAHCSATDKAIGEIIAKAKELGIYENSIIVFTSDHGEMMGAHGYRPYMKHLPYSESANIPFLISYPGIAARKGKTAEAPLTTPDILPSLLSLCNIPVPQEIEGYDLSDIMKAPEIACDRVALFMNVCPFGIAFSTDEYRALKTSEYTYVKTMNGPSMLFNNKRDPQQMINLIEDPGYSDIIENLDDKLMDELARINESKIEPRTYYTRKFGYEGRPQFREDYAIKNYHEVEVVVSPNKQIKQ
jgi:arylsulfatase A-like enzyme